MTVSCRQKLVDPSKKKDISISRQCKILGVSRSGIYYTPREATAFQKEMMCKVDEIYTQYPFYGSRRIVAALCRQGYSIGRRRVVGIMHDMGIKAIYQEPKTSVPDSGHKKYPYLLKGVKIIKKNQVWSSDITYIHTRHGKMYLVGVIDWYSRKILSWRISNTMDEEFCREALEEAISKYGKPEIFNTDQGSQFTGKRYLEVLTRNNIKISMDGKGRCRDNIIMERFWRSLKYEDIYIKQYATPKEAIEGIRKWIIFYNTKRYHSSLEYLTPDEVYSGMLPLGFTKETLFSESPLEPPFYPFIASVKGEDTSCPRCALD